MSKLARVTIPQFLAYRGGQPMVMWLLHRLTGIGLALFVSMHVLAAFLLNAVEGTTGDVANALTGFYEATPMQIFMLFSALFHGLNGLRIVILDMWPALHRFNREAMWVQWALFLPSFFLPALLMVTGTKI
jgi:succinate dehydrogenase / fumarate reductase cytochrome b subunit